MALIGKAGISSEEKALIHDRDRNFDPIITKFGTQEGLLKLKI